MNTEDLAVLHRRIREAELPGYSLHYCEGPNQFYIVLHGHNGEQFESREHGWDVMIDWAKQTLKELGA